LIDVFGSILQALLDRIVSTQAVKHCGKIDPMPASSLRLILVLLFLSSTWQDDRPFGCHGSCANTEQAQWQ
jgi:hypothetical protein